MGRTSYFVPPLFLPIRGCGKSTLQLMMFMEYLRILDMFEYLNKYRGVALPKIDLTGVVKEYYRHRKSQYELKLAPLHPIYQEQLEAYSLLNLHHRSEDKHSMMIQRDIESVIKMMEETKQIEEIADRTHQYYRARCLGEFTQPKIAWPKQKQWGYLHEDGTKQYI